MLFTEQHKIKIVQVWCESNSYVQASTRSHRKTDLASQDNRFYHLQYQARLIRFLCYFEKAVKRPLSTLHVTMTS